MMRENMCFLMGHHIVNENINDRLRLAIKMHIEQYGVQFFVVGVHGTFDTLAAHTLTEIKKEYGQIKLCGLLSNIPSINVRPLPMPFDEMIFPSGIEYVPPKVRIIYANKYMIDSCGYIIAYYRYTASNIQKLLGYANRRVKCPQITYI